MPVSANEESKLVGEPIVGLDIGTSKVSCVIAQENEDGQLVIIGVGSAPSKGVIKGTIVDMEKTKTAIRQAVEAAETMAGCEVGHVYVGIAGKNICLQRAEGMIALNSNPKDTTLQRVTEEDIDKVKRSAMTSLHLSANQDVIHVMPLKYVLDDEDLERVHNPLGMSGSRLKACFNVITASANAVQNIRNCVKSAGLETDEIILEPIASSAACLAESDRETGVCLIDIGHGTTDISVYHRGVMVHSAVIPLGGSNITMDLAIMAKLSEEAAERIKIKYGTLVEPLDDGEGGLSQLIDTSSESGTKSKPIPRRNVYDIVTARVGEILQLALREIEKSGQLMNITCGAVLTGGASQMAGMDAFAEQVLGMSIRLGKPQNVGLSGMDNLVTDNPAMSTCVGLVLCQAQDLKAARQDEDDQGMHAPLFLRSLWEMFRQYFA